MDKHSKKCHKCRTEIKRIASEQLRAMYDTLCYDLSTTVTVMRKYAEKVANLEAMIGKTALALKRLDIDVDNYTMKIDAANTNVRMQDHNCHSVVPVPEVIIPIISRSNHCTVTSTTNLPLVVPPSDQCVATSTAVHNTLTTLKPTETFPWSVQASSATTNAEKSYELLPSVVPVVAGFESISSDEDIDTVRNEVVDIILKETLGAINIGEIADVSEIFPSVGLPVLEPSDHIATGKQPEDNFPASLSDHSKVSAVSTKGENPCFWLNKVQNLVVHLQKIRIIWQV